MTTASLVTGNVTIVKPSSETPTIAHKFAEVLLEAGFPPKSFSLMVGSGAEVGDIIVTHPKTRFISFTGSRDVGLRINELAAKPQKGQIWIKRVVAEMGGKDAIVVDREVDVDAAVHGVMVSAFGYQGQKCSACSRAIVDEAIYDEFVQKLRDRSCRNLKVGPPEDPNNYMGPVISDSAKKSIMGYIEQGKRKAVWSRAVTTLLGKAISLSRRLLRMSTEALASFRKRSSARFWRSRRRKTSIKRSSWRTILSMV